MSALASDVLVARQSFLMGTKAVAQPTKLFRAVAGPTSAKAVALTRIRFHFFWCSVVSIRFLASETSSGSIEKD